MNVKFGSSFIRMAYQERGKVAMAPPRNWRWHDSFRFNDWNSLVSRLTRSYPSSLLRWSMSLIPLAPFLIPTSRVAFVPTVN